MDWDIRDFTGQWAVVREVYYKEGRIKCVQLLETRETTSGSKEFCLGIKYLVPADNSIYVMQCSIEFQE